MWSKIYKHVNSCCVPGQLFLSGSSFTDTKDSQDSMEMEVTPCWLEKRCKNDVFLVHPRHFMCKVPGWSILLRAGIIDCPFSVSSDALSLSLDEDLFEK